jgi:lipoprotein signal peptidase
VTTRLDWVRAGALAAGVFTLLVIWWIGLAMLGYLQWPLRIGWTWYGTAIVSVAAGATLAHRQPEPWLRRILLALLLGGAIGGALFGLVHALVTAGLRARGLTAVLAVLGGALVAWGLRRPESQRVRRC